MSDIIKNNKDEEITYSDDDLYNISSWGADLSFREIIAMYEEGDLVKPELQRNYVWSKEEASRFIDSILLGLPVPSIFFAKEANETKLIVDGYQRIMTVYDYVKGIFSKDKKPFRLSNKQTINKKWKGKLFVELSPEEQRRIRNTTIHAIIFEQKYPTNDTGMYQIFERINTGGRILKPQEIRNCVYQGNFNKLLFELNTIDSWRNLIHKDPDSRMADLELILRYFAIKELYLQEKTEYQINLIKYLNLYMAKNQHLDEKDYADKCKEFIEIVEVLNNNLGQIAFRNIKKDKSNYTSKVSPSIYDALMIATRIALDNKIEIVDLKSKYKLLCTNEKFIDVTSQHTTNTANIRFRIELAYNILYGE